MSTVGAGHLFSGYLGGYMTVLLVLFHGSYVNLLLFTDLSMY